MAEDCEDDLQDTASDCQDVVLQASWKALWGAQEPKLGGSGGVRDFGASLGNQLQELAPPQETFGFIENNESTTPWA